MFNIPVSGEMQLKPQGATDARSPKWQVSKIVALCSFLPEAALGRRPWPRHPHPEATFSTGSVTLPVTLPRPPGLFSGVLSSGTSPTSELHPPSLTWSRYQDPPCGPHLRPPLSRCTGCLTSAPQPSIPHPPLFHINLSLTQPLLLPEAPPSLSRTRTQSHWETRDPAPQPTDPPSTWLSDLPLTPPCPHP